MTKTTIYEMEERSGKITRKAEYTIEPQKAIIAYIQQKRGNYNTWTYPATMEGIRESQTVKNHFYYDDIPNNIIIAVYPI
jgi:ABC-type Mn2+/Zn2+ transport system ATPase subunit